MFAKPEGRGDLRYCCGVANRAQRRPRSIGENSDEAKQATENETDAQRSPQQRPRRRSPTSTPRRPATRRATSTRSTLMNARRCSTRAHLATPAARSATADYITEAQQRPAGQGHRHQGGDRRFGVTSRTAKRLPRRSFGDAHRGDQSPTPTPPRPSRTSSSFDQDPELGDRGADRRQGWGRVRPDPRPRSPKAVWSARVAVSPVQAGKAEVVTDPHGFGGRWSPRSGDRGPTGHRGHLDQRDRPHPRRAQQPDEADRRGQHRVNV